MGRFNSRTLGRVRHNLAISLIYMRSFNSRTLGRVRRPCPLARSLRYYVSIHAPWEGCDLFGVNKPNTNLRFQFTHPGKGATTGSGDPLPRLPSFNSRTLGRVRPRSAEGLIPEEEFQFTHPGKGATRIRSLSACETSVSIHAPWEGCDASSLSVVSVTAGFNSRTLGRVRLC